MTNINLHSENIYNVTFISDRFIDEYMPQANGNYVKVYIFLMKCLQKNMNNISASSLADVLELTESDIVHAFRYWEKRGLMKLSYSRDGSIDDVEIIEAGHTHGTGSNIFPDTRKAAADMNGRLPGSTDQPVSALPSGPAAAASAAAASAAAVPPAAAGTLSGTGSSYSPAHAASMTGSPARAVPSSPAGSHNLSEMPIMYGTSDTAETPVSAAFDQPGSSSASGHLHDAGTSISAEPPFPPVSHGTAPADISRPLELAETEALSQDTDFKWTCEVIQTYLGRLMNARETELVSYLHVRLGFSNDLLLHLYEYCIGLGKTSPSYIRTVALSWHSKGVKTPEQAEKASAAYNSAMNAVAHTFGLNRMLTPVESDYVEKWQNEYNMHISIICEACSRTILQIHEPSFNYADGILDNWYKNGISTMHDVKKADEEFKTKQQREKDSRPAHDNSYISESGRSRRSSSAQDQITNRRGTKSSPGSNQFTAFPQRDISDEEIDELEKKLLNAN